MLLATATSSAGSAGWQVNFLAYAVFLRRRHRIRIGQLNPLGYSHYGMAAAVIMFVAILISAPAPTATFPCLMPPPPKRGSRSADAGRR